MTLSDPETLFQQALRGNYIEQRCMCRPLNHLNYIGKLRLSDTVIFHRKCCSRLFSRGHIHS